jgi:hypothetical protein
MLPTILTEQTHFYKENEELCKPHLNKPYISYSSIDSWFNYPEDFIKQKFAHISLPDGIYAMLGTFVGEAIENGEFGENEYGFTGLENVDLKTLRPEGAEYEKMILIDRGAYVIVGFIDIYTEYGGKCHIRDMKSGGAKKEFKYQLEEYIQTVLYGYGMELQGKVVDKTDVYFIRRTGSHFKPPLNLSEEQFVIPLEYNEQRVKYALDRVDKAVKEIAELYKTYVKIFDNGKKV